MISQTKELYSTKLHKGGFIRKKQKMETLYILKFFGGRDKKSFDLIGQKLDSIQFL